VKKVFLVLAMGLSGAAWSDVLPEPAPMIVTAPVADVRAQPSPRKLVIEYDPEQETQVEKGEPVMVFERKGDWSRIEATDQPEYTHNDRWQGYPGWVLSSALGSNLKNLIVLKPAAGGLEVRKSILDFASRHLGEPYVWGGRSLQNLKLKKVLTGVDCSGLVNWSFRQAGFRVPRDAHEQYMRSRRLSPVEMKPGDLFFLAKSDRKEKIVHVGFYAGGDDLIEAPQTGDTVHRMTFTQRFGKPFATLKPGDVLGDRIIYFGTLFPENQ
jgi:cell wall-associated NlpC family hydrolase